MLRTIMMLCVIWSNGCMATHQPSEFLHHIQGSRHEGAQIVEHFCAVCHASHPEIAIGAPRMHYFKDWQPRLKQGMSRLFKHTDEGVNAMPPRGGCFECTDAQLLLSIESIIGKDGQKYIKNIK